MIDESLNLKFVVFVKLCENVGLKLVFEFGLIFVFFFVNLCGEWLVKYFLILEKLGGLFFVVIVFFMVVMVVLLIVLKIVVKYLLFMFFVLGVIVFVFGGFGIYL